MSDQARYTESAWQAVHAVDVAQTVTISRSPYVLHEDDPIGRPLLSAHPSTGRVYAVMAGLGIAHFAVTRWLDANDPGQGPWHTAFIAWQSATLAWKIGDVAHNTESGIRLFGHDRPPPPVPVHGISCTGTVCVDIPPP